MIADVSVSVEITHTYLHDLQMSVAHPSLGDVTVFNDIGNGVDACTGEDMRGVVFDDESANALECVEPGPPSLEGDYLPDNMLSAWDGADPSGVWTVQISDDAAQDTGTLDEVCIRLGPA